MVPKLDIDRTRVEALATGAWLRGNGTVLLQGPPGVGKTHLAVSFGVKTVQPGFSVQYHRCDELGFEAMCREKSSLFFRLAT